MSSYLVDTHCHLDLFKDIQNNVNREDNLGIKTITVTNSPSFYEPNVQLFASCKNIRVAIGLHPELIGQFHQTLPIMEKLIFQSRFIGEIGMDGSKEYIKTYSQQLTILKSILIKIKESGNKILTVHTRNAARDVIQTIFDQLGDSSSSKVILHWYTGGTTDMMKAIDYGYYFSINHKMLQSNRSRENIRNIPEELLLTETDAPFTFDNIIKDRLSSLNYTIKGLATIKNRTDEAMKNTIYENFRKLLQ